MDNVDAINDKNNKREITINYVRQQQVNKGHKLRLVKSTNVNIINLEKCISAPDYSPSMYMQWMKYAIAFIEVKDHYTKRHCERTSAYASFLAKTMNLSGEQQKDIQEACIIHDVGKIAIPDDVLTKSGELTAYEFEEVKLHTSVITPLLPEKYFSKIKKIIRAHHERYDGKGYPDGLAGDDIPLESRIISVVDSFDAMTTQRGYNQVKTIEEAKKEIIRNSGTQFDPNISQLFVNMLDMEPKVGSYFERQKENLQNYQMKK